MLNCIYFIHNYAHTLVIIDLHIRNISIRVRGAAGWEHIILHCSASFITVLQYAIFQNCVLKTFLNFFSKKRIYKKHFFEKIFEKISEKIWKNISCEIARGLMRGLRRGLARGLARGWMLTTKYFGAAFKMVGIFRVRWNINREICYWLYGNSSSLVPRF